MRTVLLSVALVATLTSPCFAQSLYLSDGERAVEASVGWSVGPSSNGIETFVSAGFDGRLDVGVGISRYKYTFDDGFESIFKEYAPFVRYFPVKQQDGGAPVSLAVSGQFFVDDYTADEDSGKYVQLATAVYRDLKLSERWALQPFIGFGFVAESYSFGGAPADRAQYLTRDLGLHVTTATDRPWVLRMTLIEQSFRRETYRGARASIIRRF